jgi:hypothetical protein
MPRRPKNERVVRTLIDETFRGYLLAARTRVYILEMCDVAHRLKNPEDTAKVPDLIRQAIALSRMCDGMSNELQRLHELQAHLHQNSEKDLRVVIEHVESPQRSEYAQHPEMDASQDGTSPHQSDMGQSEA